MNRDIYSEIHAYKPSRMILTKKWKYIYTQDSKDQLNNVSDDQFEQNNLAFDIEFQDIWDSLKNKVLSNWNYK